jgi:cyclic pyranopterin phosphate synthase
MDTLYYEAHNNLYLNVTNRCTADCIFCVRNFADGVYGYDLRLSKEPSEEEIIHGLGKIDLAKYREIVFTGFGEPTLRLDTVLAVTRWLKARSEGLKVRLDTNGHASLIWPERDVVFELKTAGIDSISVSLNAESEYTYNKLCRPVHENAYPAVLYFINEAKKAGIHVRATIVEYPGIDVEKCRKLAKDLGADFHERELSKTAKEQLDEEP